MGRRIRWLGVVLILCFALVLVQLANVQFRRASALANSPSNPKNQQAHFNNGRGVILAADGTILAQSNPSGPGDLYHYTRTYPLGPLTAQVVGFDSLKYGTTGVEYQYNSYLVPHSQPAKTLSQLLSPPPPTTDNVTLTLVPSLQQTAEQALANVSGPNKDGAVVAINPTTGAVEAMYGSPSYNPNYLASPSGHVEDVADYSYLSKDGEGFSPSQPMTTVRAIAPGSTFKVVTTSAVYDLRPDLSNFNFPPALCIPLPNSPKQLCNDSGPCGGMISSMLPQSCDPGYGQLGLTLGGTTLYKQASQFGYDSVPPIDLPDVSKSGFPNPFQFLPSAPANSPGLPGLAYSAIGQEDVTATALQNALVAAGIANGGVVMTPHVMAQIRASDGTLVTSYQPKPWLQATTQSTAAQVTALMQSVVTHGTAAQCSCISPSLDAAVKTGTAQTGPPLNETDDWMIGFAPANNPKIAVAVVVPYQAFSATGALVAGPIMNAMLTAALAQPTVAVPPAVPGH